MTKRKKATDLTEAATVERAKSMANEWMWAVSLQHSRITDPRAQDKGYNHFSNMPFNEADIHFLVIALGRLRAVATTLKHIPEQWESVAEAIKAFDSRLPWRKPLRDAFEHMEDYAVESNSRHIKEISRKKLQVWSGRPNGINWLGYDIDWEETLLAAKDLFGVIMTAYKTFLRGC